MIVFTIYPSDYIPLITPVTVNIVIENIYSRKENQSLKSNMTPIFSLVSVSCDVFSQFFPPII